MYLESSATAAALWSRSADFLSKDPGTLFEEVMLGGLGMVTPGSNLGNFAMADTTSRSSLLLLLLFDDDCLGLFSTEDEDEEDASLSLLKKALQTE